MCVCEGVNVFVGQSNNQSAGKAFPKIVVCSVLKCKVLCWVFNQKLVELCHFLSRLSNSYVSNRIRHAIMYVAHSQLHLCISYSSLRNIGVHITLTLNTYTHHLVGVYKQCYVRSVGFEYHTIQLW